MKIKELAKELNVSPSTIRYYFYKWCRENNRRPEEFMREEEYQMKGGKFITKTIILPKEAVDYIKKKRKAYRPYKRKITLEGIAPKDRPKYGVLEKRTTVEIVRDALESDQQSVFLATNCIHPAELSEILKIVEEKGKKIMICSDEPLVIYFL